MKKDEMSIFKAYMTLMNDKLPWTKINLSYDAGRTLILSAAFEEPSYCVGGETFSQIRAGYNEMVHSTCGIRSSEKANIQGFIDHLFDEQKGVVKRHVNCLDGEKIVSDWKSQIKHVHGKKVIGFKLHEFETWPKEVGQLSDSEMISVYFAEGDSAILREGGI